ncbi:hypothetical protein [Actinomadura rupiterrae]|uniref:hypothetical protein n=1 Tax=Actinomadura rupiterrae TaxID=559627 RepID=UPI0020A5A9BB|nr:hypothetical protein [Actinomadura rupiterrae]MCP2338992.1 hypothetical protein [Actinomadura rupiterrae]
MDAVPEPEEGVAPASPPRVDAGGLLPVAGLLGRLLRTGLAGASLPVLLGVVVAQVAGAAIALALIGDGGYIVNGQPRPSSVSSGLVVGLCAVLVALLAVQVFAASAVSVISAGLLLGRPVSARAALGRVARRAVALAVVGAGLLLLSAGIVVAYAVAWSASGFRLVGLVVALAGVLLLGWLLLVPAVVVLEDAGPRRALVRTWEIVRLRRTRTSWHLGVFAVAVPVLVGWGLGEAARLAGGALSMVLGAAAFAVAGMVAVLMQGAAPAIIALDGWYSASAEGKDQRRPMEPQVTAGMLPPSPAPRRTRPVVAGGLLVAAVALPGLLLQGLLTLNPFGMPSVTDHVVKAVSAQSWLLVTGGDRPLVFAPRLARYSVHACTDQPCTRTRQVGGDRFLQPWMDAAELPDGSVAVAAWLDGKDESLRLVRCDGHSCPTLQNAPPLRSNPPLTSGLARHLWVSVAPSGPGVAVAAVDRNKAAGGSIDLHLLKCERLPCASPVTAGVVTVPSNAEEGLWAHPLAVATGRGGRPVAAFQDLARGDLYFAACTTTSCPATATRLVSGGTGGAPSDEFSSARDGGVSVVVPPDDRPLIAYRDGHTGTARLLRCRTPACPAADPIGLGDAGSRFAPSMALGPDGLPVIATYGPSGHAVTVIACRTADCARRTTSRIAANRGTPGPMDLAVGRNGRPRVLWYGRSPGADGFRLHLTTCRHARCDAG